MKLKNFRYDFGTCWMDPPCQFSYTCRKTLSFKVIFSKMDIFLGHHSTYEEFFFYLGPKKSCFTMSICGDQSCCKEGRF